jgi:hypothetical protein
MMHKAVPAALCLTVILGITSTCLGAEPAAEPKVRTGYTNQPSATPTVGLTANEIRATSAIGANVFAANGAKVATIGDLIADRKRAAVDVAILDPAGGVSFKNGRATVAWESLKFEGKPDPTLPDRAHPASSGR